MRTYWTFFKMRLINGLQYRTAAWAGVATQFFWGFMEVQLYRAFYEAAPGRFPMALSQVVSYIWLRQALLVLMNGWAYENELFDMIIKGDVAYELCRPVSLYGMWFTRTLALRVSRAALRCLPILIVACLLPAPWGLESPASPAAFLAFLLSLALAAGVVVAFSMIVYFSCFYTVSSDGIRAIVVPLADLLSGSLVPLPFMPAALAAVVSVSPFGAMQNVPLRVYSGSLAGREALWAMALQALWLGALVLIGREMQRRGMKKLTVGGG